MIEQETVPSKELIDAALEYIEISFKRKNFLAKTRRLTKQELIEAILVETNEYDVHLLYSKNIRTLRSIFTNLKHDNSQQLDVMASCGIDVTRLTGMTNVYFIVDGSTFEVIVPSTQVALDWCRTTTKDQRKTDRVNICDGVYAYTGPATKMGPVKTFYYGRWDKMMEAEYDFILVPWLATWLKEQLNNNEK